MTLMMKLITAASIALTLFTGCTNGEEFNCAPLPDGGVQLITNFISADNSVNDTTTCMMRYEVPDGANLWQGMMAASQQHGDNFTFMATLNYMDGHSITTVNGVTGTDGYFWEIFDAEGIATPVGVDSLDLEEGDAYIFNYQYNNASDTVITNYTGTCLNAPDTTANMPLTYFSTYLTVSDENTEGVKEGTNFKPVCNQLVLFDQSEPSLYDVMMLVNDQIPLDISVILNPSDMTVTTLNNITNQGRYAWTPFNVTTNMTLPRDLSTTQLSDGGYEIEFVFAEIEDPMMTTRMMTTTRMTTSGAKIMTPSILILSSIFMIVGALFI